MTAGHLLFATVTTAYRYFRINITANNGDASFTEIGQLYLFMASGGVPGAGSAKSFLFAPRLD
jgi:hypothetical protein